MEHIAMLDDFLLKYPYYKLIIEGCEFGEITANLLLGNFQENFNKTVCEEFLSSSLKFGSLENNLISRYEEILKQNKEDSIKKYEALCLGISSLQYFVQLNWTGPLGSSKDEPPLSFLRKSVAILNDLSENELVERLTNDLVLDGEAISPNIRHLELLLVARALLFADSYEGIVSADWWRLRCLFVHQQVLEERSPVLYGQLTPLLLQLSQNEKVAASSAVFTQLHLETASIWLYYGYVVKAYQAVRVARKLTGLETQIVGALGKRTYFQQKEVAQLTLDVEVKRDSSDVFNESGLLEDIHLPKDVRLEDDVRLQQVAFTDSSVGDVPSLTASEQAIILSHCMHLLKSQPKDKLQSEEVLPYLTCLSTQKRRVWALSMTVLLQRSKLESDHKRTVDRSLKQFETLTKAVSAEQPSAEERLAWLYCSYLPPAWRVEALLANACISLGLVKTALDIFLKLKLWEEVIACYNAIELRHKAAEIIEQELEKKPTVMLLCLLGDATDNVDCYRQAWELSNEKSARAQRHWGMYYFSRKKYAESIPYLEKSLALNSLQETLWFRLGYAALTQENWTLCASAYRSYCTLESESFEAWNNLAKAYVKMGQKERAFRALQEAVKCNYENWKVWDNLMNVSANCGQWEEVVRSYNRILDLLDFLDEDMLKVLTNVIVNDLSKSTECPTAKLRNLTVELFKRITISYIGDRSSTVWQLYAQIVASDEPTPENQRKVVQNLQKAFKNAITFHNNWDKDIKKCDKVIDLCINLVKAYVQCSSQCSSSDKKELLHSAKLQLKSVLTQVEKAQADIVTRELPETLNLKYKDLLSHYEQIVSEVERLQPKAS